MENETKLALFVGGNADGFTQEITKLEPRINWYSNSYILRQPIETKTLGIVQVYILEDMKSDEENLRIENIKKAL